MSLGHRLSFVFVILCLCCASSYAALVSMSVSSATPTNGWYDQGDLIEIIIQIGVTGQPGQSFSGADFKGAGRGIAVDTNYLKIHDVAFGTALQVDTQDLAISFNGVGGYTQADDTWWYDWHSTATAATGQIDFTGSVDFSSDGSTLEAVPGIPVEAGLEQGLAAPFDYLHLVFEVQAALADPWMATTVSFTGQLASYDLIGPNQVSIFGNLSAPGQDIGSGSFLIGSNGFFGADRLVAILTNWASTNATRLQGDMTGEGFVGADDLTYVLTRWDQGELPEPPASTPEPASLTILSLVSLAGILQGHHPAS